MGRAMSPAKLKAFAAFIFFACLPFVEGWAFKALIVYVDR